MAELILKPAPKAIYLGEQKVKLLQLGGIKEWPTCNPTKAGIAIDVLQCTVKEPATGPVTVDWGDGNSELLTPSGGEVIACHEYATPGVRTVSLTGAVTKAQKVNAGVVPANTVLVVHKYENGIPEFVYQWDGNGAAAGRDTKEATPFCDGVFRQHLWIGDLDAAWATYTAFDVSCRGTWWDITGGGCAMQIGISATEIWHTADEYKMVSQVHLDGIEDNAAAQLYYLDHKVLPGTSLDWVWEDAVVSFALIGTSSGKLITLYMGNDDKVFRSSITNRDNLLDWMGDPAGSHKGALPPGLDLTMMPTLLCA